MRVKRSGDVTAAAVVMFFGSGLLLLVGAFVICGAMTGPAANAAQGRQLQLAGVAMAAGMYVVLAAWGIATGVGIIKLQPWARISAIVMSALAIAGCAMSTTGIFMARNLFTADKQLPPNFASLMVIISLSMLAIPAGVAIWWVILFTRKRVALEFATRGAVAELGGVVAGGIEQGSAYGREGEPGTHGGSVRAARGAIPISIRVIAVLSIVFCALALLALPFFLTGTRVPILIFGVLVQGKGTLAYFLAADLAPLAFGIATLRRMKWGLDGLMAYFGAMILNLGMFCMSPARAAYDSALRSVKEQMLQRMNVPAMPQPGASRAAFVQFDFQSHAFQNYIFGLTVVIYLVIVFFLATRRRAFREACAE